MAMGVYYSLFRKGKNKMNKEQEDLIATGIWLLIKNNDKIKTSTKEVWMYDYDKLFGERDASST